MFITRTREDVCTPMCSLAELPGAQAAGPVPAASSVGAVPHIDGPTQSGPVAAGEIARVELQFSDPDGNVTTLLLGAPGAASVRALPVERRGLPGQRDLSRIALIV